MKKAYLVLLLLFLIQWSHAQIVNISSPTLHTILVNFDCADIDGDGMIDGDVDTNDDGLIQVSEAEAVNLLSIRNQNGILTNATISSLSGLDTFVNVTSLTFFSLDGLVSITNSNIPNGVEELGVFGINSFVGDINLHANTSIKKFITEASFGIGNVDLENCSNLEEVTIYSDIESIAVANCSNLVSLQVSGSGLTSLDLTGCHKLVNLDASNNLFETLDLSEIGYEEGVFPNIYIGDNPNLRTLNIKNGSLDLIFMSNCPALEYICTDEGDEVEIYTEILMNDYPTAIASPYCSFIPGGNYIEITGTATLDINTNGCDVNDPIFPSMEYQISYGPTTETVVTNTSGDYTIYLPEEDTYTITPQLENPSYFTVSPTSITINAATASNPTVQDFCVTPNGTHDDVEVTIIPIEDARPGFDTTYQILYKNKGTTTLSGNVQLTFDDDLMDLVVANPIADTQALHSLTWNYANLTPLESRSIEVTMNINTPTDVPAVNGNDVLTYEVMVTPAADDETPDNNIMTLEQTVVNSFDPNDIRCLEGETVTTDYIGKYVHYLIRFENTGTASAVNVVVTDEIDTAKFDITTLRPVASSHAMVTNIKNENEVEFIFENINLPFDDASNDGYLVFKVKTLTSLVENDTFENSANIYFDFNALIITNTASTLIQDPLSVAEENLETAIKLYPNPAKELVQITSQTSIEKLELRTIQGKLIKSKNRQTTNFSSTVNISSLPTGIYLIKITTTRGTVIKKIVKQ